ncbi:general substrate transporter [Radiomyces spectabilis]|uniref:general substrate transporter n=1 Tax=Radiomyces spectabilis TaxID=64574 RepID=UPI002220F390|nr:general substrate transporter [Radiomyces spectabilis]KAI8365376.1 general substrate transporter [Radiomyces spectabilis]
MADAQYSLVVSMLTAGGLLGALSASYFNDHYGRRLTLFGTSILLGLGSAIMTLAASAQVLMLGRFIAGVGSGIVTVVVPAYIAECVPKASRGFFGSLNQLAIVIGILVSQVIGMQWSTLASWRWILGMGVLLAAAQLILLPFCVDSPRHLASQPGGWSRAKASLLRLRGPPIEKVEEEISLWRREWAAETDSDRDSVEETPASSASHRVVEVSHVQKVNIWKFLTGPQYRRPLCILLLLQLAQQLSGINAVIFYSTSIMSAVVPESSSVITVYISVVNLVMTLVSAYLMDRAGRRTLFLWSTALMAFMSGLLGWSMQHGFDRLSAVAIIGFVAAFAIGLGPIPFLMIPEIVGTSAASTAGSIALASNMISNFTVGAGFLGLASLIGQGQVFYLFASMLVVLWLIALRILPETKGRSADEVVQSGWAIHSPDYQLLSRHDEP